jgi:hypothetical protein
MPSLRVWRTGSSLETRSPARRPRFAMPFMRPETLITGRRQRGRRSVPSSLVGASTTCSSPRRSPFCSTGLSQIGGMIASHPIICPCSPSSDAHADRSRRLQPPTGSTARETALVAVSWNWLLRGELLLGTVASRAVVTLQQPVPANSHQRCYLLTATSAVCAGLQKMDSHSSSCSHEPLPLAAET